MSANRSRRHPGIPVFLYQTPGIQRVSFDFWRDELMAAFLLAATIVTNLVLAVIAVKTLRLGTAIRTRFARLQALIVVLLCVAGLVASIEDIGFHLIRLGWLPESIGGRFLDVVQGLLVMGGLVLLGPILVILRRLTKEFARTEGVAEILVDRLPAGLSLETAGLTKRELEVVSVVGKGRVSDREIADELTISPATAATHLRNIMRKTGIKRRGDLALLLLDSARTEQDLST